MRGSPWVHPGNNAAFMAFGQGPIRFARAMVRAAKKAAGKSDPEVHLQASHQIEQRVRLPHQLGACGGFTMESWICSVAEQQAGLSTACT